MSASSIQDSLQECIDQCLHCYRSCTETAMLYCLEAGGKHSEPHHVRLMLNCPGMCRTTAEFMISNLQLHRQVCAVCGEVGDMVNCVVTCRACAESCRRQAVTTPFAPRRGARDAAYPAGHSTMSL